jgi:ABC-type sugar transport system permease subunit
MQKTVNQKAWFLVLPVLVLVAFSAVIPLMTVVNYSVQDTFGNNVFFWAGLEWFEEALSSDRMWAAFGRQIMFSATILAIEIPLGIFIALNMPKRGFWASFCLVLMALPLLIPWNVVGTIWQIFARVDIGLLGHTLASARHRLQLHPERLRRLDHGNRHGRLALDLARGAALLCRAAVDPRGLLPGGEDRPGERAGRYFATSSCRRCREC